MAVRRLTLNDPVIQAIHQLTASVVEAGQRRRAGENNIALTAFCGALALAKRDTELFRALAEYMDIVGPEAIQDWWVDDLRDALRKAT